MSEQHCLREGAYGNVPNRMCLRERAQTKRGFKRLVASPLKLVVSGRKEKPGFVRQLESTTPANSGHLRVAASN